MARPSAKEKPKNEKNHNKNNDGNDVFMGSELHFGVMVL